MHRSISHGQQTSVVSSRVGKATSGARTRPSHNSGQRPCWMSSKQFGEPATACSCSWLTPPLASWFGRMSRVACVY